MTMNATVLRTASDYMLVRDDNTGNEVRVNTRDARRFSPGDLVSITYSGAMTRSIPPQISAVSIRKRPTPPRPTPPRPTPPPQSDLTEMRAVILVRRQNSLLVRDMSDNRQILVNFPHARHFCVGQRITVRYDSIKLGNPPVVNAIDITPIC